jgi:hypothetical protein
MSTNAKTILIERGDTQKKVSIEEFEQLMQISFLRTLTFESRAIHAKVLKKTEKLHKKGELSHQQLWFGSYFKQEMESLFIPDVVIRYINPILGWGIFANRDFRKMEFIAEYSGLLRKRRRDDRSNAYCFEYTLASGVSTKYTIDAETQGGIARLINHSTNPNLLSALATKEGISHVILITSKPVEKGTQLSYDYGPDYWSKREKPIPLTF